MDSGITGLGDTIRGNSSQSHKALPAEAQEEQSSLRDMPPVKRGLVPLGGRSGQPSREADKDSEG